MTLSMLLGRFFGVVKRSRTWTGVLYHLLAFPLGVFYFVFLAMGILLGVSLVIVWVGLLILLVTIACWWFFGAAERLQARYLLGADVPSSPRAWEAVDGVWAKLKAHLGSGATWTELVFLSFKLLFGLVSFSLLLFIACAVGFLLVAVPVGAVFNVQIITWGGGGWTPGLWAAAISLVAGVLLFITGLHLLNGWSWLCARWAELLLIGAPAPRPATGIAPAISQPEPIVQYTPAHHADKHTDTVNSSTEGTS